jgi:uncharacterized protein (DUF1330 family)
VVTKAPSSKLFDHWGVAVRTSSAVALATLAGFGIGAVGMYGLRAQPKTPVYEIAMIDFTNANAYFKEFAPTNQALVKAHGGVFEALGPGTVLEGSLPGTRFAIVRWGSLEQLRGWHESPEYTAAHKIGMKYAKITLVAVNGVQ